MNTYMFFIDNKSAENEALLAYLKDWCEKLNVSGDFHIVEDLTTISTILQSSTHTPSTYICVGKQTIFSALLAYAKLLPQNAVVAYIPLTRNPLAQKLGLRGQKDACRAISQRKLFDIHLYSINQYYMLFDYQLMVETTSQEHATQFFIDKQLQVKVPSGSVKFINKQFDTMHPSKLLVVESYETAEQPSEATPILQNLPIKTKSKLDTQLQFRLPFSTVQIESSAKIISPLGTTLKQPVQVGLHHKTLRLIVKRGFELNENQPEELLSSEES
jgi:hypothetical protein